MTTAIGFTNSANSYLTTGSGTTMKSSNCAVCLFAMMSASTGSDQVIWQLEGALGANVHCLYYDFTTSKTLVYENPSSTVTITTINMTLGQWYFIGMVTLDGYVSMYVKPVGTSTCRMFSATGSTSSPPTTMWIGNLSTGAKPWLGSICSVKFWDENNALPFTSGPSLTQEEFERESEQIFPVRTADLRCWFALTNILDFNSDTNDQRLTLTSGTTAVTQTIGPPIPERRVYSNPPYDIYW